MNSSDATKVTANTSAEKLAEITERFESGLTEASQPFLGWDFGYITGSGRLQSGVLPWSYGTIARRHIQNAKRLLDMGTGGGELLCNLAPLPAYSCATEGYLPNIAVAQERLQPLGVKVFPVTDDAQLPFADGKFDLVINRHESYDPREVRRVLAQGGVFLTQQVGWSDGREINDRLGVPMPTEYAGWELDFAVQQLLDYGFHIRKQMEAAPVQRIYDIGALVYYLKTIPWQVPDFTAERFREPLWQIHMEIEQHGFWDMKQKRFIIEAVKL
ncbi:class I SAM-dependent methyltransferase [Paenibacillus silvae]|uniref:class I SAM-dependent methyltransferase n=1 Tax=Paenibacillus silvae TaxID=1325358 RepID=UPI0011A6B053|nr:MULTISPECIES: class I SAM-dependent methyltransferase [Paenibacillus]MCK6076634.1 class I SAM-dependent methyltransferase [Paenibacillus silvae]MCK6151061.1 class I SAM-dependent methyltransferase [Paenibacillus silvae]MCK6269320.1 class I SAM-dependent methyltransferase [Paenibacillus silvae]